MPRDGARLAAEIALLERALQSALTDEAAFSLAPRGSWVGGTGGKKTRGDARFTWHVNAALSDPSVPQHIRRGLPAALRALSVRSRGILRQTVAQGRPLRVVAWQWRVHPRTVQRVRYEALVALAHWFWADGGEIQNGAPPDNTNGAPSEEDAP